MLIHFWEVLLDFFSRKTEYKFVVYLLRTVPYNSVWKVFLEIDFARCKAEMNSWKRRDALVAS